MLKEVKWTLWVKEELEACCRRRAQAERELGRQMCLLLTAPTEHLMARDGGPQPPPSMPLVSHFITFSRTPLSAFANMSSHHLYFRVISIVSPFLHPPLSFFFFWFCFVSAVLFFWAFLRKVLCFSSLCSGWENRDRRWCLGDCWFFTESELMYSLWCDIQPGRGNAG